MFRQRPETRRSLTVTAISSDAATLEGLGGYLNRRVTYRPVFTIREASKASLASDCVVLYPDAFPAREVQNLARRLIGYPTVSLAIIVTARPYEYQALDRGQTATNRLVVLSPPVWPWTLFATIQSSFPILRGEAWRLC
jgi:hypothetical protein